MNVQIKAFSTEGGSKSAIERKYITRKSVPQFSSCNQKRTINSSKESFGQVRRTSLKSKHKWWQYRALATHLRSPYRQRHVNVANLNSTCSAVQSCSVSRQAMCWHRPSAADQWITRPQHSTQTTCGAAGRPGAHQHPVAIVKSARHKPHDQCL